MINDFKDWYNGINKARKKDYYAPHKPISILYALSKVLKSVRWVSYNSDRAELEDIIGNFTKFKSKPDCLQPLWRLTNDSKILPIWTTSPSKPELNSKGDINVSFAMSSDFKAGFSEDIYQWLTQDKFRVQQLIQNILEDNFPDSLHGMILELLGIFDEPVQVSQTITALIEKPKRDPNFPKRILSLYDNQCACCGLKLNYVNSTPLNMEAAHIKWKARGGECNESNGMALCPTHHYTFDRGIWTLSRDFRVEISESVIINKKNDSFFSPFQGKSIGRFIMDEDKLPAIENILWHQRNILK